MPVEDRGGDRQDDRKHATPHGHIASRSGRTVLLCSTNSPKKGVRMASLTWLGHASFLLDSDGGKRIYVDPFLGGPTCPDDEREPERVDVIASRTATATTSATRCALQAQFGCPVVRHGRAEGLARREGRERRTRPRLQQGRHDGGRRRQVHADERVPLELGTRRDVHRRAGRLRDPARGRQRGLLRRRHLRVRRHAADRAPLHSPTWRCCRSATTSRWARTRRRWRSSCSATRAACRATGGRSRCSSADRRSWPS